MYFIRKSRYINNINKKYRFNIKTKKNNLKKYRQLFSSSLFSLLAKCLNITNQYNLYKNT